MLESENFSAKESNPPSELAVSPEASLRQVNLRLASIEESLKLVAKPPPFRLADGLSLLGIIIAVATVLTTGLALSARLDHVDTTANHASELLSAKLDRFFDRIAAFEARLQETRRCERSIERILV